MMVVFFSELLTNNSAQSSCIIKLHLQYFESSFDHGFWNINQRGQEKTDNHK